MRAIYFNMASSVVVGQQVSRGEVIGYMLPHMDRYVLELILHESENAAPVGAGNSRRVNPAPFFDLSGIMDDLDFLSRPMANFFSRNAASDGITATNDDAQFARNYGVDTGELYLQRLVEAIFYGANLTAYGLTLDCVLQLNPDGTATVSLFDEVYLFVPQGMCPDEALNNHFARIVGGITPFGDSLIAPFAGIGADIVSIMLITEMSGRVVLTAHALAEVGGTYFVIDGRIIELHNTTYSRRGYVELDEIIRIINNAGVTTTLHRPGVNDIHGTVGQVHFSIRFSSSIFGNSWANISANRRIGFGSGGRPTVFSNFICDRTGVVYVNFRDFMRLTGLSNRIVFFDSDVHGTHVMPDLEIVSYTFATGRDAKLAFAIIYGPAQHEEYNIENLVEFAASIYSRTTSTGTVYRFGLVMPGEDGMVFPPADDSGENEQRVGIIHTHPVLIDPVTGLPDPLIPVSNKFSSSPGDGQVTRAQTILFGRPIPIYLVAPNGTLLRLRPDWQALTPGTVPVYFGDHRNVTVIHDIGRGSWLN